MGCGDACPVFPGKRYLDWKLDDPAGQGVEAVRPIRDEIERRVRGLLAELGVEVRMTRRPAAAAVSIAPMRPEHAEQVLAIYQAGIDERQRHLRDHRARPGRRSTRPSCPTTASSRSTDGQVLGWAAVVPVSDRCAYAGVVEHSVYVHPDARGRGVGLALLQGADRLHRGGRASGRSSPGSSPRTPPASPSTTRAGFRVIGIRERIGRHHGRWRDVVLIERRSPAVD